LSRSLPGVDYLTRNHCVGTFTWLLPVRCGERPLDSARVGIDGTENFEEAVSCQFSPSLDLLFLVAFKKCIAEWQGLRAVVEGGGSGEGEVGVGRTSNRYH
jgi:hypothetical protein